MRTMQRIAITLCALMIAALGTITLVAQTTAGVPTLPAAALSSQAAPPTARGPQEGIKVHGHWTIDIRDADGTFVKRHEFENALATHLGGDRALAQLLAGTAAGGQFTIALFTTPVNACNSNNAPCQITEASSPNGANSRDLVKSVPTTGPDAGKLVLTGTVRVPAAATITTVQTDLTICAGTVAPTSCVSASGVGFTQKILSPAVPVQPNQFVDVKVVVSFS